MRPAVPLIVLAACSSTAEPDLSVEEAGAFGVATRRVVLDDDARGRSLTTQVWYPGAAASATRPIEAFEPAELSATIGGALATRTPGCTNDEQHASEDAPAAAGAFPVVLFSHCHECLRFSSYTVAERLASHGFVVVAVDHEDNTLYDWVEGDGVPLDADFLPVRGEDVRFVLDAVLAGEVSPAEVDPERIGVFGHSFGSVTAGLVAQDDARIDAAFGIAAPMENPLIEGVSIAEIDVPLGFLVAVEDNSITELGNTLLRDNHAQARGPAWKIEVPDAGHWSFSDLVGLEPFPAGCGDGARQTDGQAFSYLDPATGRAIAAAYVTAFFRATLDDDAGARAYLTSGRLGVLAEAR